MIDHFLPLARMVQEHTVSIIEPHLAEWARYPVSVEMQELCFDISLHLHQYLFSWHKVHFEHCNSAFIVFVCMCMYVQVYVCVCVKMLIVSKVEMMFASSKDSLKVRTGFRLDLVEISRVMRRSELIYCIMSMKIQKIEMWGWLCVCVYIWSFSSTHWGAPSLWDQVWHKLISFDRAL